MFTPSSEAECALLEALEVYKADFGGDETSFVDFVVCQLHTRNQTPGGNQAMVNWYLNRAAEREAQGTI